MGFLITLKYAIGEVFKIRALATIPGVIAISIWLFSMLPLFLDRRKVFCRLSLVRPLRHWAWFIRWS